MAIFKSSEGINVCGSGGGASIGNSFIDKLGAKIVREGQGLAGLAILGGVPCGVGWRFVGILLAFCWSVVV
jgi:hypothetical protein